jgi:hypothetical protein
MSLLVPTGLPLSGFFFEECEPGARTPAEAVATGPSEVVGG